jgi:hypothetical protein
MFTRKRSINCVKDGSGRIHAESKIPATRFDLDLWMKTLPRPWTVAMEATIFTGWIYDHLRPHAAAVKVAHPLMPRAIAAAKKKNDRIDANKIADGLRCDFLPDCSSRAPHPARPRFPMGDKCGNRTVGTKISVRFWQAVHCRTSCRLMACACIGIKC